MRSGFLIVLTALAVNFVACEKQESVSSQPGEAKNEGGPGSNPTALVSVRTNLALGTYEIQKVNGTHVSDGSGTKSIEHSLPVSPMGTGYKIIYGQVADFNTPKQVELNLKIGDKLSFGPDQGAGIYQK